jgi:hypothetical protein
MISEAPPHRGDGFQTPLQRNSQTTQKFHDRNRRTDLMSITGAGGATGWQPDVRAATLTKKRQLLRRR